MITSQDSPQQLRVAVAADNEHAAQRLVSALCSPSCLARPFLLTAREAPARAAEMNPSVLLVRAGEAHLRAATGFARAAQRTGAAVVLLTPHASSESVETAQGLRAMTHLLEPVTAQALLAAVFVSHARTQEFCNLEQAVLSARHAAEAREVVEQAKQVLMRRFGLGEEEAHRMLQKESRSRNRKLIETAEQVLRAENKFARSRSRTKPHVAPAGSRA